MYRKSKGDLRKGNMNFSNLMIMALIYGTLVINVSACLRQINNGRNKILETKKQTECTRFIYQSFCNTCNGTGFESLEKWQITCRALWKPSYIGWSPASDFMLDPLEGKNGRLYYGTWKTDYGGGEVYSRIKAK